MTRAYVLCGGFGTRLRSVTGPAQKALVRVHGEPFLARVLRQLAKAGITEAVLCAHYRADQVQEHLQSLEADTGLGLHLVVEASPLGTGGALLNALHERPVQENYLVLNADTFLDARAYQQLIQAPACAVLGVEVTDRQRYGALQVNEHGQLRALTEKGEHGPGLINAGVYRFTADAFASESLRVCSMEQDLLPKLLQRQPIDVVGYCGRFIDIGTPESFAQFSNDFKGEQAL